MKKLAILLILAGCTFEVDVPVDEIEIPPIENNTTIIVNLSDGFSLTEQATDIQEAEVIACDFQEIPDYELNQGYIIYCSGAAHENQPESDETCCTWAFPERIQVCEEKWCLNKKDPCGWRLISWECHSY
jgi:hypothetical protein